ncbi:MAG: hypothetical protein WBA81_06885 [Rhodococcus sp. (in: high G+C Gram-positive bacteria)]
MHEPAEPSVAERSNPRLAVPLQLGTPGDKFIVSTERIVVKPREFGVVDSKSSAIFDRGVGPLVLHSSSVRE